MSNGKRIEGEGVIPDRPVPLTIADLRVSRDRALEEAQRSLRGGEALARRLRDALMASLNPGVARREVVAWAMYDFANSGYTTVVLTAVFNAYFVSVVAGNAPWATFAWTAALSVSYALVMVGGPLVGAWADAHAAKKRALLASTVVCCLGTVALAWTGPGAVTWAVVFIVVSNFAYSIGENLCAAFLPELARPEALGKRLRAGAGAWGTSAASSRSASRSRG